MIVLSFLHKQDLFSWVRSQQFSSYNSVGLMYSCKYLWWNLSNSPGTLTLIYWETLAGMLPQITLQFTLLTAGVITQLKHHTVREQLCLHLLLPTRMLFYGSTWGDTWQKVMLMSTCSSLLFHGSTSQKIGCRINKLNANMQTCPSICRFERKLTFKYKFRLHVSLCRPLDLDNFC